MTATAMYLLTLSALSYPSDGVQVITAPFDSSCVLLTLGIIGMGNCCVKETKQRKNLYVYSVEKAKGKFSR